MIVRQVSGTADNEESIAACPDVLLHSVKQHRLGCQCDFAKMPLVLLIEELMIDAASNTGTVKHHHWMFRFLMA